MGEEDAFPMVQKWRVGWSWFLKDQQILNAEEENYM